MLLTEYSACTGHYGTACTSLTILLTPSQDKQLRKTVLHAARCPSHCPSGSDGPLLTCHPPFSVLSDPVLMARPAPPPRHTTSHHLPEDTTSDTAGTQLGTHTPPLCGSCQNGDWARAGHGHTGDNLCESPVLLGTELNQVHVLRLVF